MSQILHIKAFFFNAKTDYLPYYKTFTLPINDEITAKDLLASIAQKNENFSYPQEKLIIKMNGLIVEGKETVGNIVSKLGTDLTIEPVNTYRSNNGLIINNDDFMKSFKVLEPYTSASDLSYYQTLYALHYASENEKFDHTYLGDAILVLAHKIITDGSEHKQTILDAIKSTVMDCEYEHNLFDSTKNYKEEIENIKSMYTNENEHPTLLDMFKTRFCKEKENPKHVQTSHTAKTIENINTKYIAYNAGNNHDKIHVISQMIKDIGSTEVKTTRQHKLSGASILATNKQLALKKAGTTLLDAYDAGAELIIIDDKATYTMMEKHFTAIEKNIGRRMGGFELQLADDFVKQVSALSVK